MVSTGTLLIHVLQNDQTMLALFSPRGRNENGNCSTATPPPTTREELQ